jgi:hypothetical protein
MHEEPVKSIGQPPAQSGGESQLLEVLKRRIEDDDFVEFASFEFDETAGRVVG